MELDIREIPFSRFGSYFCVSQEKDGEDIYIRDLHGGDEAPTNLFKISIIKDGIEQDFYVKATEISIEFFLKNENKKCAELIIPKENEIHIQVEDVEFRLQHGKAKYDTLIELNDYMYEYHIYPKELKLMIINLNGELIVDAPWNVIGNEYVDIRMKNGHFVIESYRTVYKEKEYDRFADGKNKVAMLYNEWFRKMGYDNRKYKESIERAVYITWANFVRPDGILKYHAMYMSKLWMNNIWSWDNCFNAIVLAKHYPELAFDQLKIFIDTQDESGVYPDFVNDKFVSYNCIKPPIFTWCYNKLMERNEYFHEENRLRLVYESTKKVLDYFKRYRTYENRLPHYKHGNDSGWDNASLFHVGMPVEAPDLTSHLIRTYDTMAEFAEKLGEEDEAKQFRAEADSLFTLLMDRLYDKAGFFGRAGKDGKKIEIRSSLILRLPIIIGYRLEKKVRDQIVKDLVDNFETKYGLATESYKSDFYTEDGYWLGPIWAPVTYLIIDALKENNYIEMADRLRDKFLELTLIGGMAENFDPFTGKGLVDTAFAWTSSVFLLLLEEKELNV